MDWLGVVLAATWKGTLVLALAFLFNAAARHSPAAIRHLVWSLALAGILALPALSLLLPAWEPFARESPETGQASSGPAPEVPEPRPSPAPPGWPLAAAGLWAAGVAIFSARLAWGYRRVYAGIRDAETIRDAEWADVRDEVAVRLGVWQRVALMKARTATIPMAWGVRRPLVLLPATAGEWTRDRRSAVLMHEMAHIRRKDFLAQAIGQAACALYWFNPLVWMAARRLALERERACDDSVLQAGLRPSDYAGHLVGVVRSLEAREEWAMAAVTMAGRSQLDGRLRAILDGRIDRRARRPAAAAALAALMLAGFLFPLAAAHSTRYSLEGVVLDPSGARVPRALVTLRNPGGSAESVWTGGTGEFSFSGLAAGGYALEVRKPGFAVSRRQLVARKAAELHMDIPLRFGARAESMEVRSPID